MSKEPIDGSTQRPERVEDRPNVGTVRPENYPEKDRAAGVSDPPPDEEKEKERLNPGSIGHTPGGGRDRDNA